MSWAERPEDGECCLDCQKKIVERKAFARVVAKVEKELMQQQEPDNWGGFDHYTGDILTLDDIDEVNDLLAMIESGNLVPADEEDYMFFE